MTMQLGKLTDSLVNIANSGKSDYGILIQRGYQTYRITGVDSWRGSYHLLALGYTDNLNEGYITSLEGLIDLLVDADQSVFEGYKGGEFRMHTGTDVWCDNYGISTCYAIKDVEVNDIDKNITIVCRYEDY